MASRVQCIGTLYSIKLINTMVGDNLYLRVKFTLKVNGDFVNIYMNTPKYKNIEYYRILETFSVPYDAIREYDDDSYSLSLLNTESELGGSYNDYKLPFSDNPSRLLIKGELTPYGIKGHYVVDTLENDTIEFNVTGTMYKNGAYIIPTLENIIHMNTDHKPLDLYSEYELNIEYNNIIHKDDGIIVNETPLTVVGAEPIGSLDRELIDDIITLSVDI